jgi:oligopeptide transport system ATP-binding protein
VSLTVAPGAIVGLAGESGSGKTLTGLSAMGFLPDRARATGSVRFAGEDVLAMQASRLRRMRGNDVAVVFQDPMTSLHPMLSVGRQLTEHVQVHLGLSRAEANALAIELLTTVRLPDPEHVLTAFPHQFSGGMRQRIAIASALACGPKLLIADEPTTALDVTVQAGILRLLDRLRRERDLAVLI